MTPRTTRWIAWAIVVLYFILAAAGLTLQGLANTPYAQTALPVLIFLVSLVGVWTVTGARIISRHPQHPVGWLLCAGLITAAIDMFAAGYASYDTYVDPGLLPGVILALAWLKLVSLGPHGVVAFTLIILLFPDGRFPSPGWRKVAWTTLGALLIFLPLQAVEPGFVDPSFLPGRTYPLGVSASTWTFLKPLMWTTFSILVLCYGAAFVSLIVRLRNSHGDVRQQIKWLLFPAGLFGVFLPLMIFGIAKADDAIVVISIALGQLGIAGMVIATALAIFKYRLYDIDIIINRTLVYGGLTVVIAALYALSVGATSLALQQESQWAGLLLTGGLMIVLYLPLRSVAQRGVDLLLGAAPIVSVPATVSSGQSDAQVDKNTRSPEIDHGYLPKRWRRMAYAAWILCAAIATGIVILSMPSYIANISELHSSPATPEPTFLLYIVNAFSFLTYTAAALISLILAGVLFLKKPNEIMTLFLSFFLLAYSIAAGGPIVSLELFWPGTEGLGYRVVLPVIVAPLLVTFLATFPSGQFKPPWTRMLVIIAFVYAPVRWLLLYTNAYPALTTPFIQGGLIWFGLISAGLYAQVYRYRHTSNPTERQQTKWILYGFTLALLLAFLLTAGTVNQDRLPPGTPFPWLEPLGRVGWSLVIAALPVSLTFAVMRYRLYDIDIIINRSLVYGVLTGSVIALYALMVGAFSLLFRSGDNLIVALVATGLVAVLFQPLRERLQRAVNRLMYGDREEPFTVLRRLGERLESSGMPEEILAAIVETVTQALKLPYAEIAIRHGEGYARAAWSGKRTDLNISFPIHYQGKTIACLIVSPRGQGESLAKSDETLLRQIARQSGPIAHSVQLTRDLRRSRARLVTTREEERRRLQRDLHDGLGPVLASQGLKIAAVNHLLDSNPDAARKLLRELATQNEVTVAEIRRLVYALRPPELDKLGLVGAIRDYAAGLDGKLTNDKGPEIEIGAPDVKLPGLPAAVEVAAYRIAMEALTNVTRHAQASHCQVSFRLEGNSLEKILCLEISDDGIGIPRDRKSGVGMNSMRERAEEVRGELHIESSPQKGTRVIARLPLAE